MTRARFLNDLYRLLAGNGMNEEQAEQHLTYYAEMLADRMEEGMTEDQAVDSMEDVDTIARRILEEEGHTYRPLGEGPLSPPKYPNASGLDGGGGTRAYQVPGKWNWRRVAPIALWALAAIVVLGAVGQRLFGWGGNTRVDRGTSAPPMPMDTTPVEEVAAPDAPYAEWEEYGWDMPYEFGYEYASGIETVDGGAVDSIDIQWVAGMVQVQSWSGDDIQFQEYSNSELNSRTAYYSEVGEGKLTIRYRENMNLGVVKDQKFLVVMVPDSILEELEIKTTSADVLLNSLEQQELDVSSTSGDIVLTECYVRKAELESVSGELQLNGIYGEELELAATSGDISGNAGCVDIEVKTTSGDVSLYTGENMEKAKTSTISGDIWLAVENEAAQSIDVSSTSGDVSLSIPFEMGFTLDYATVSGELYTNSFDVVGQNGQIVYEGGGCKIKVETISGGLNVY